ncbi:uncharacterized protein C2845_PM02G26580 [Panicum miliaceum]|uniref:Uncharacterized protein n=1 Tax=Panicum miliaceum TaxID=4540 RepID=A0A3L6SED2_PANMI|nr:uncharacterized protein C2845_PM02G26580 [Panicum miliaceum]
MAPKSLVLLVAAVGQVRGVLPPSLAGPVPSVTGGNPIGVVSGVVPCSNGSNINPAGCSGHPPLLSGQCRVVVATPLVACNVSLAGVSGTLTAPLQLLNSTTGGVIRFLPGVFSIA